MRTSWRRKEPLGNTLTSWKEAYRAQPTENKAGFVTHCLYEDVSGGTGDTLDESKQDFLDNIRLRIAELTDMLQFCAENQPRQVK